MKRLRAISFLVLLAGGISSLAQAADPSTPTVRGQIADWSFIQAAGGIQFGLVLQTATFTWKLPLLCNLNGKETFTQKPTSENTGVRIQKILVQQEGKDIFISLLMTQSLWTLNADNSQCTPVTIDSTKGSHAVYYRDGAGKTFPMGIVDFNNDSDILNKGG